MNLYENSGLNTSTNINLKQTVKVYLENETNKKYIDILDAKALGLIDADDIIIGKPRLHLIDDQTISKITNKGSEVEFIILSKNIGRTINLYYMEDDTVWIDLTTAYSLDYIDNFKVYKQNGLYGPLNIGQIDDIKKDYDYKIYPYPQLIDNQNRKTK